MADAQTVTFGGATAYIRQRTDGRWKVYWREARKPKSTTNKTKAGALEAAKAVVRRLSGQQGGRVMTTEDAALVDRLKAVCGDRHPVNVLSLLEDVAKRLDGLGALEKAVRHYEASGMASVTRLPMITAVNRFLDHGEKQGHKTLTRAGLRKELNAFAKAYEGLCVCEIEQTALADWISRGEPAPRFFNNRLATWKTFFNRCRNWGLWPAGEKHPGELIPRKREASRMPPIWTVEQLQTILAKLPLDLRAYVVLGCFAGLRPYEITRLEWSDFDWKRDYIHIRAEVAGKTLSARYVPMEPVLGEWLAPLRQAEGKVCRLHDREYASQTLRKEEVITSWPQDVMRHSYISYRIARGDGAGLVAEHSGNSERIIRKHYRQPLRKQDGLAWFAVGDACA